VWLKFLKRDGPASWKIFFQEMCDSSQRGFVFRKGFFMNEQIHVKNFGSQEEWIEALIQKMRALVSSSQEKYHVCLAGGKTPKAFYEKLSLQESFPWEKIIWWIGDERCVSPDSPRRNEYMIQEAFLSNSYIDTRFQLKSWGDTKVSSMAAKRYEKEMLEEMGNSPRFDLVLLGVGYDGHTASLFPEAEALYVNDSWTTTACAPDGEERLTLTFLAFSKAREVLFLADSKDKKDILKRFQEKDLSLPCSMVQNPQTSLWVYSS